MRTSEASVIVSQLDIAFGGAALATGVCFEVEACGRALAVIGQNGIGKTSLLRLIGGDLVPPRNTIVVNGRDVSRRSAQGIARLGVVWCRQLPRVVPELGVIENILLGAVTQWSQLARPWRASSLASRAQALAQMIDLPLYREVGGLSAGQRRAVELCRCFLMPTASVYLLDEPAVNLDVHAASVVGSWTESVLAGRDIVFPNQQRSPSAVIIVEHQLERLGVSHDTLDLNIFAPMKGVE